MSGPALGERVLLDRPLLLGRDARSRIAFDDERISRHHALIDLVDSKPVIRDLGSKNGTFVNGAEIKELHFLKPNDRVRIGKTLLAVVAIGPNDHLPGYGTPGGATSQKTLFDSGSSEYQENDSSSQNPLGTSAIDRRLLRQATDLVGRLTPYVRTRFPLYPIIGGIRREFRADGAGVFEATPSLEPVYTEGDFLLPDALLHSLRTRLSKGAISSANLLTEAGHDSKGSGHLICFPVKPADEVRYLIVLRRDESRPFVAENLELAEALVECLRIIPLGRILERQARQQGSDSLAQIIGSSDAMNNVRELIHSYAATDATVLVTGESGTGKELCARAIYQLSDRRFSPYVELNSACMMPELIESELFGHEKGAFTGATERTLGKLELANGGTLFLDEIGELPLELQAKLLRVLEGQPYYRLGGRELISVDVRFICATNRSLEQMVEQGLFRADLFHRINVLNLAIPPLRTHSEDIPELVPYLMQRIEEEMGAEEHFTLDPKVYRRLLSYSWPGNVRELRNVLQRMMLLSTKLEIDEKMVPPELTKVGEGTTLKLPRLQVLTEMMEREEITRVLLETGGHKSNAAKVLGISRPTLDKKIKQYGLSGLIPKSGEGAEDPPSGPYGEE
jgi:DNA-binding NtrC family response regulator